MDVAADAAGQIISIALDGVKTTLQLTGETAAQTVAFIAALTKRVAASKGKKDEKSLRDKQNLKRIVEYCQSHGQDHTIVEVPKDKIKDFEREASRYGFPYTELKESGKNDKTIEVMVPVEYSGDLNRAMRKIRAAEVEQSKETEKGKNHPNAYTRTEKSSESQSAHGSQTVQSNESTNNSRTKRTSQNSSDEKFSVSEFLNDEKVRDRRFKAAGISRDNGKAAENRTSRNAPSYISKNKQPPKKGNKNSKTKGRTR